MAGTPRRNLKRVMNVHALLDEASQAFWNMTPKMYRRESCPSPIQDAWLAFARSGDPSSADLSWPAYSEQRETMVLGDPVAVESAPRDAETRAWDGIESLGTL